jgi:hypothetical protein
MIVIGVGGHRSTWSPTATDHLVTGHRLAQPGKTLLVTGSYFGTYAVLFILKFVLFDRLVFAKPAAVADPVPARIPSAGSGHHPPVVRAVHQARPSCWLRRPGGASSMAVPPHAHRERVLRATTPTTGTALAQGHRGRQFPPA